MVNTNGSNLEKGVEIPQSEFRNPQSSAPQSNIPVSVLIVDDNEQNLYLLSTMLKGQGYDVLMAANGVEALEQARRVPPDIIISDMRTCVPIHAAKCPPAQSIIHRKRQRVIRYFKVIGNARYIKPRRDTAHHTGLYAVPV